MVDYREILRLQSLGHNITQIAGALHSSRNTVREVERLADEKGIRWPFEEEVTNPVYCIIKIPTIAEGNPQSCMRIFPIIADAFGISLRPQ